MGNNSIIKYKDVNGLWQIYQKDLGELITRCDICSKAINVILKDDGFTGAAAAAVKNYLSEVHLTLLSSIQALAQKMLDYFVLYKSGYYDIEPSTDFVLPDEFMESFRSSIRTNAQNADGFVDDVNQLLNGISDIFSCGQVSSQQLCQTTDSLAEEIATLRTNTEYLEQNMKQSVEGSISPMLNSLQNSIRAAGTYCGAVGSYQSGAYSLDPDVFQLKAQCSEAQTFHENNAQLLDALVKNENILQEQANAQTVQGVWEIIGGVGLVVAGAACIAATAGAATPVVVAAGAAVGGGTVLFGVSDMGEGASNIYHGVSGDIDSTAVNILRDTVFLGNEAAYRTTENAFAFTASAMVPIGAASQAHTLTFRSGAVAVGKLAAGEVAGQVTSDVVTEATDNPVLGMLAGMAASNAAGKGLNALDSKLNLSGTNPTVAKPTPGADSNASPAVNKPDADVDLAKLPPDPDGPGKAPAVSEVNTPDASLLKGEIKDYSKKFDRELVNFNDGYQIKYKTDTELILVQFSSDLPDASLSYWTTVDAANGLSTLEEYMDSMAISKDWGNRNTVKVARIPAGTEVKYAIGTASPQLGLTDPRPGGGVQLMFETFDTRWIKEIRPFR